MAEASNIKRNLKELLTELDKKHDENNLFKILSSIRTQVQWPEHQTQIMKLHEWVHMKNILETLKAEQKRIIDVSLSIIGNCVMVIQSETYVSWYSTASTPNYHEILISLEKLMKRYPEETSINAKIFNIIGNTCLSNNNYIHFISVYHIQFVKQILHFLEIASNEDTYSEISLNMAVRFLRILMHFPGNPSFIRDVVGAVWCLFEKVVAEWKKTGRKQKLLKNIIKLVEDISEQKEYYLDMVKETSLECLSQVALLSPKRIVDIFQSFLFARSSMMKDPRKLPIRETFDAFRNLLLSSSAKELGRDYIVYIECICSMMVHPFERDIERSRSCVKLLIKTLESFNNPSKQEMMCWITILETFMVHKNVTAFVNDLMDCNIIHILTDTLRRALGIPNNPKLQLVDMYTVQCYLRTRMIPREDELLYISDDEYHTSDDEPHFSDDEPHFSDDECQFSCKHNRFCHSNYQCDMLSSVSPDGNIIKYPLDEYLSQLFEPETDSTGRRTDIKFQISEVRRLLIVRTTQMVVICRRIQPTHPQFGSKEFLLRMIQGAMFLPFHSSEEKKIVEVIIEILKCPTFLVSLMQTDIIEQIYDLSLYESRKLDALKQPSGYEYEIWAEKLLQCFFCTANSEFGNGCTKKALMEGDETVKALIVNVIPYTQEDPCLHYLLVACGGLKLLTELVGRDGPYRQRSLSSLCFLTKKLNISKNDLNTLGCRLSETNVEVAVSDGEEAETVTFKMDDGSLVKADVELLTKNSQYFVALFSGRFRENVKDEIALHNVDLETFQYVLNLLERPRFEEYGLDILLDILEFSDQFLLTDLYNGVVQWIESTGTNPHTVSAIYRWSVESTLGLFRKHVVRFILTHECDIDVRFDMVEELYGLGYTCELSADNLDFFQEYVLNSERYY